MRLPGLTKRAAEALKPFVDEAMRLEREGKLDPTLYPRIVRLIVGASEVREFLAALRESQKVAEGIRLEREA